MYFPRDARLAASLLERATRADTFPGLPRPSRRVLLAIAPDERRFRAWIGSYAPEWGAAIAFPGEHRIVMQGSAASSDAGDPSEVLPHELAHLALHEYLGDLPPRWFDEGYAAWAAGEWGREETLATNVALALRGVPGLARLDSGFYRGAGEAQGSYALAFRAVAELAALDQRRGLTLFFRYWKATGSMDRAVREAYGITLPAFEDRFQRSTRRRYGLLALVGDLTVVGVLFTAVLLPLYVARRRRDRRRLAALVEAERLAAEREEAGAIEELLRTLPPPGTITDAPGEGGGRTGGLSGGPSGGAGDPDEPDGAGKT